MMSVPASAENRGWIQSPRYDLGLLALSPLLGIAVCGIAWAVPAVVLSGASLFVLGMPHYLSTYTFYMDDSNLSYYRTRKVAFFLGPVLIVGFLTLALASALEKIESAAAPTESIKQGVAHLCIEDPRGRSVNSSEGAFANLFATHPPIAKRIALLKEMAYQRLSK